MAPGATSPFYREGAIDVTTDLDDYETISNE